MQDTGDVDLGLDPVPNPKVDNSPATMATAPGPRATTLAETPHKTRHGGRSDLPTLTAQIADAVPAVVGVVRLQPTLSTDGPQILVRRTPTDGLHVVLRADTAEVDVNLVTSSCQQARGVAHQTRSCITEIIQSCGYAAGSIMINILAVEP